MTTVGRRRTSSAPRRTGRKLTVRADPPMPAMADDMTLGDTRLTVAVRPRSLWVMAGDVGPAGPPEQTEDDRR